MVTATINRALSCERSGATVPEVAKIRGGQTMKYNIYFAKDANFNIGTKMITVSNVSEKDAAEIAETMKKAYGLRFHMILRA